MYGYRKVTYSKENCLNTVSKQCNAISMGLSKQKSSTHTRKQVLLLKYCVETAQCYFNGIVETEIQSY